MEYFSVDEWNISVEENLKKAKKCVEQALGHVENSFLNRIQVVISKLKVKGENDPRPSRVDGHDLVVIVGDANALDICRLLQRELVQAGTMSRKEHNKDSTRCSLSCNALERPQ